MLTIPYEVLRLAKGGHGVSLHEGKVFFVEGGLPGEAGIAEVREEKDRFGWCRPLNYREPSPHRELASTCRCSERCECCGFRHVRPGVSLELKAQAIYAEILKFTGLESIPYVLEGLDCLDGTRRRVRLHLSEGRLGFYARGSHEVISASSCPVVVPALRAVISALEGHLPLQKCPPLDLQIDLDAEDRAYMAVKVVLPKTGKGGGRKPKFDPKVLFPWCDFLVKTAVLDGVLCGGSVFGADRLREVVDVDGIGLVTWRRVGDFAQATAQANAIIHRHLVRVLAQAHPDFVVDLFSGSGNLTFRAATLATRVEAYEFYCDPEAFEAGKRANGAHFVSGSRVELQLFDLNRGAPKSALEADFLICDPAREGMSQALCDDLCQSRARTIFYVSCESSYLARDMKRLASAYRPVSLAFVDMFPQTPLCETVAVLERIL